MTTDSSEATAYTLIAVIIIIILVMHVIEGACQQQHDVADCEWSRTPFTPVMQNKSL